MAPFQLGRRNALEEPDLNTTFGNLTFLLLGIYGWEYFTTFGVEYAVLLGRLPFRWPLLPYLAGRISLLFTLLLLSIQMGPLPDSYACQPGITCVSVLAQIAIGTSSTNLMIRTWVIWKNCRVVQVLLTLVTLAHWTLLTINTANIRSHRSDGVCVVDILRPGLSAGVYLYTTSYDFLVLVLAIEKLSRQQSTSPLKNRLYAQGILYFVVAAVANVLPTVFTFLGPVEMVGITANFAMTASTIVSCRAVRSLLDIRTLQQRDASGREVCVELDVTLTTRLSSEMSSTVVCT